MPCRTVGTIGLCSFAGSSCHTQSSSGATASWGRFQGSVTGSLHTHGSSVKHANSDKGPKGPHIMHLSTMCHLFDKFFTDPPAVSEVKSKMSQLIRGQGRHLVFPIVPPPKKKKKNLVDDVGILLPVKFRWIPFSSFRGEVENVSGNQRPWLPSRFSDRPEKHKLGRGLWDLASCQVSLNSIQWFQRRRRKCLSQSKARAAILFFWSARKTQTWSRMLRSYFLSSFVEFRLAVSEEKLKMSQAIRGQGCHLVFPIGLKNTNLVDGIEILLPVKFRWISFSSFRGEVVNVSANQRPGRPSCFSDRPEKHKLGKGSWDLASCQVSLNSVKRFQKRKRKRLSQSVAMAAILFIRSAWKTQTW